MRQVTWPSSLEYRAFFDGKARASLISSHLSDEAEIVELAGSVLLAVDSESIFCDLETSFLSAEEILPELGEKLPVMMTNSVKAKIYEQAQAVCRVTKAGLLQLAYAHLQACRVEELCGTGLRFGLDREGVLSFLICPGVAVDPSGAGEAAWLDEVEVRSAALPHLA